MNKIYFITTFIYCLLVEVLSFLILILFGILADENIKFDSFEDVYVLGIGYDYNFLMYLAFVMIIFSFIVQIYTILAFLKNKTCQHS